MLVSFATWLSDAEPEKRNYTGYPRLLPAPPDTTRKDSLKQAQKRLSFYKRDRYGDPYTDQLMRSPLLLKDPSNVKTEIAVDTGGNVTIQEKIGDFNYRPPTTLTYQEFADYNEQKASRDYWRSKTEVAAGKSEVTGRKLIPKIYISPAFDRLFGGNYIDFQTNGFVTLDFGAQWQRVKNPNLPIRQQRFFLPLNFDQQINLNFTGKVGEKLKMTGAFDTKSSFQFEQNLKLEYTGFEHDIIQKIEAGNVSMPLNSTLIQGVQNLFGLKTQLRFGKLNVSGILANQRSRITETSVQSGVQRQKFEFKASEYEDNRHFFLGQFFRNTYETSLQSLPIVNSGINITRLELYVTNRNNTTETLRNLVAFLDLGESTPFSKVITPKLLSPILTNDANNLFEKLTASQAFRSADNVSDGLAGIGLKKGRDFEILRGARRLSASDFTYNNQLGYVSLNTPLRNDEILAVAFEYTYNGKAYKVGELPENTNSLDQNQVLFLKMLRPSTIQRDLPTWDLMMKNIYSLGTGQVNKDGFQLRVIYKDDLTGVDNPSLQEGANTKDVPLLEVVNLDKLNPQGDFQPDGNFDWVEGVTIDSRQGRIIFPVLEPFGSNLTNRRRQGRTNLPPWLTEPDLINKYVFSTLYKSTKQEAQQAAEKNKFFIKGSYQTSGSSNQVPLGLIGVDPNSVVVSVGGRPLVQGVDYIIENGQVTILNEGILQSGQQIDVRSEQPDLFQNQVRTLTGARLEYQFDKDFSIGSTIMRMRERPLLRRVSLGNEPTNNTIIGFDVNLKKDSRFLTRMLDKLPFLSTKEISTITFNGEFAKLFPGVAPLVAGNSYIDDFEGAETPFDMTRLPQQRWRLGSTPSTFLEAQDTAVGKTLQYAFRRAKLAWYSIDNTFYRDNPPSGVTERDLQNHYVRSVVPQEIFPAQGQQQVITNMSTMDLAYYPKQPGMYNYNTNLDANGLLKNDARQNWASISRGITYDIDFDNANIQYIEFWMMDPFINGDRGVVQDGGLQYTGSQRTGGDVYFNLGNVSEDVMKNNRHDFENGLPINDDQNTPKAVENVWGKSPGSPWLNNAFDNNSGSRQQQDVGLDGVRDDEEQRIFNSSRPDPSGDNFAHPLDPKFDNESNLLTRYKDFNGYQDNSQESTGANFSTTATTIPDNEDLNNDQTISDLEDYYQYKIQLRREQMQVGKNYIVNVQESNQSGENVKWYQFRIPIREYEQKFGNIQDFKSIRFMRMFLTNFDQPHVLRLVNFQLVANQWRIYERSLSDKDFQLPSESYNAGFSLGTVNIEENSTPDNVITQFPYKIPPNLPRDRDITTVNNRFLNEQSLRLCVDDLKDRDARAIFKNVNFDFINYKRLRMFIHAETADQETKTAPDTLRAFVRLGTDFVENYYEIQLKPKFSVDGDTSSANIWPLENEIDIPFTLLVDVKSNRNRKGISPLVAYTEKVFVDGADGIRREYEITVTGNPDYSAIQTIMIGMRNNAGGQRTKKACLWVNELRCEGFDQEGGYAATGRLNIKLADFATITAAGNIETFGFGSIQQRISERARQNTMQYSVGANVNVEKLLPKWVGIKIPMFIGYERERIKPRFNPLDPDVKLDQSIESRFANSSKEEENEYRKIVEDNTTRRSINFTNVQKIKLNPQAKAHLWDLSNFTFNYSYSDITRTNITTAEYYQKNIRGGAGYTFSTAPKYIEPFKNIGFLDKSAWKWLKEFNFSLAPSSISIRGDLDRMFTKTQLRNSDPSAFGTKLTTLGIRPFYEKYFTFNRTYDLQWNLTRSLSFSYSAISNAVIDEPSGEIDDTELRPGFSKRDSVDYNLKRLGRMKNFQQTTNFTYRLPLDKFPIVDWLGADVRYGAAYNWRAAALGVTDTSGILFGNFADNSRQRAINGQVDLIRLYNKVSFLKKINEPTRRPTTRPTERPAPGTQPTIAQKDTVKKAPQFRLLKGLVRTLMTARNVNFSYSIDETTILPGLLSSPKFLGLDSSLSSPGGLGFTMFGSQNANIRKDVAASGLLSKSTQLNMPFMQTWAENFSAQADLEPFQDFKIRVNVKKTKTVEYSEFYRYNDTIQAYKSNNPVRSGSYTISFISLKTFFVRDKNNVSAVFEQFEKNAIQLQSQLNERRGGGYDTTSQDILIPAFIAAYTGKPMEKSRWTSFPRIPLPNWTLTYNGLSKVEALKSIFSSINITHSYSSTYSMGSYRTPQEYANPDLIGLRSSDDLLPTVRNQDNLYVPLFVTDRVTISERFSPLIGIDLRTQSRFTARIAYNKERTVSLITTNRQVSETNNQDVTMSIGYTKNNLRLPIRFGGEQRVLKNDVQFRCDVRVQESKTIQRRFQGINTPVAGNFQFSFKPTVQYSVNQRTNVTIYIERNVSKPMVSTSFPRSDTRFGFRLQYNLAQ